MMEPMGKIAYEAYRQRLASSEEGKQIRIITPEWDELSISEREAWQDAADAVAGGADI